MSFPTRASSHVLVLVVSRFTVANYYRLSRIMCNSMDNMNN